MINDGMSFEEMLDASFKTLRTGERVKGTVTSVTPTEVHVDLGIKYTGMIPLSELSDDPTAKTEDLVKVGDEIDVVVVKPNDAEGTILLSKKRIDADKNWDALVEAEQNGTVLTGKVIELTKGGLVMISPFGRVFIPISQVRPSNSRLSARMPARSAQSVPSEPLLPKRRRLPKLNSGKPPKSARPSPAR